MDLSLTPEQEMLKSATRRFIQQEYPKETLLALAASGVGFPEAASIALLDSALRWGTGTIVFMVVTLGYGVETSFSKVLARYTRVSETPETALPPFSRVPALATGGEAEPGKRDGGPP